MKCNCSEEIKNCCNQCTCCDECGYEDCHEGCEIWDKEESCKNCEYKQEVCDICGEPMTTQEYVKNNGFCEECGRDIEE
ncbi:hypothetical protein ACTFIN_00020 [Clostridium cagae]|uniref:hypothetical protein n=1 Tax=Clostridium cagae TaxID=2080751 RepID=UPI003F76E1A7